MCFVSSVNIQNLQPNAQLTIPPTDFPSIPPGFLASGLEAGGLLSDLQRLD